MKIKNLLLTTLAILALSSCKQENISDPNVISGDIKLKISLPGSSDINRATVDEYVATDTETPINSAIIYLLDVDGKAAKVVKVGNEKLKELKNGYTIENVSGISAVAVVINSDKKSPIGTEVKDIVKNATPEKIADIQPVSGDGISKVHMYGNNFVVSSNGINKKTGNALYEANVTVMPLVARVQIYGTIASETGITDLKVTKIFLDNFKATRDAEPDKTSHYYTTVGVTQTQGVDKFLKDYPFFDKATKQITDLQGLLGPKAPEENKKPNKKAVYAYHLFPQKAVTGKPVKNGSVKLILETKYKDGTKDAQGKDIVYTKYSTLRLAKSNGNNLDANALNIGLAAAYTIDLGKIDWSGDGKYDSNTDKFEPNRNASDKTNESKQDVSVIVTVTPWKVFDLIPGF